MIRLGWQVHSNCIIVEPLEPTTTTAAPILSTHPAPRARATRVTFWDRLAVALIGAAGFALSFDALQQMAVAIHVRGLLTYVFPLTVDGFIAYGVRALLVLRAAPWPARVYAWLLFAGATAASVWANALHAVRLNHVLDRADGLRLGDGVVGVLSTLSPLALGGAVHLYILIARHAATSPSTGTGPSGGTSADPAPSTPVETDGPGSPDGHVSGVMPVGVVQCSSDDPGAGASPEGSAEPPTPEAPADDHLPDVDEPRSAGGGGAVRRPGRPPGASMERLLEVSRPAVAAHGRPSRPVVERAVREANLPLGSTRFTILMDELRKEFPDDPVRQHPPVD